MMKNKISIHMLSLFHQTLSCKTNASLVYCKIKGPLGQVLHAQNNHQFQWQLHTQSISRISPKLFIKTKPWSSECIAKTNGRIHAVDNRVHFSALRKYVNAFIKATHLQPCEKVYCWIKLPVLVEEWARKDSMRFKKTNAKSWTWDKITKDLSTG